MGQTQPQVSLKVEDGDKESQREMPLKKDGWRKTTLLALEMEKDSPRPKNAGLFWKLEKVRKQIYS